MKYAFYPPPGRPQIIILEGIQEEKQKSVKKTHRDLAKRKRNSYAPETPRKFETQANENNSTTENTKGQRTLVREKALQLYCKESIDETRYFERLFERTIYEEDT